MAHTGSYLSFENSAVFRYNLSHLILSTNIDSALNRRQALVWWYGAGDAVLGAFGKGVGNHIGAGDPVASPGPGLPAPWGALFTLGLWPLSLLEMLLRSLWLMFCSQPKIEL